MAGYTPLPDGVPSPPDTAFAPPIQADYVQQRGVWDRQALVAVQPNVEPPLWGISPAAATEQGRDQDVSRKLTDGWRA